MTRILMRFRRATSGRQVPSPRRAMPTRAMMRRRMPRHPTPEPGGARMTWRMPAETAPHERTWMAFPRPGLTLGDDATSAEDAYAAWTAVAHAVAEFEPVTMVVDPVERERARRMLSADVEQREAPLD